MARSRDKKYHSSKDNIGPSSGRVVDLHGSLSGSLVAILEGLAHDGIGGNCLSWLGGFGDVPTNGEVALASRGLANLD